VEGERGEAGQREGKGRMSGRWGGDGVGRRRQEGESKVKTHLSSSPPAMVDRGLIVLLNGVVRILLVAKGLSLVVPV